MSRVIDVGAAMIFMCAMPCMVSVSAAVALVRPVSRGFTVGRVLFGRMRALRVDIMIVMLMFHGGVLVLHMGAMLVCLLSHVVHLRMI